MTAKTSPKPRRKPLPKPVYRAKVAFCEVCGAIEELMSRTLGHPDSGSAILCPACWVDYCEQTGHSENGPEPSQHEPQEAPRPSRVRHGILPKETP